MKIKNILLTTLILGLLVTGSLVSNALKQSAVSEGGMVGYWSLDADSLYDTDIFQDLSGNGNNGTSANTPVYASDQAGVPNQAMTFNGSSDYIDTPIDGTEYTDISLNGWVKCNDIDGSSSIMTLFDNSIGANGFNIRKQINSGTIVMYVYYDVGGLKNIDTTIPDNDWHFYSFIIKNNGLNIYVDGVLVSSDSFASDTIKDSADTIVIGSRVEFIDFWDGDISDVLIYSSTLTEDQVRQLYLSGRTTAKIKIDPLSTNYITPKLQKGLILDMPLNSRYTEAGATYTSDFSAGVDSWTYAKGTATAPNTIGGESNSLRFTTDNTSGQHFIQKNAIVESGKIYQVSFKYYIPSGQSNIDGIRLFGIGGAISSILTTTDAWTTYTKTFTSIREGFQIYGYDGANLNWQDAGGDDVFYIKNFIVKELDGTTKDRTPQGNDGTVSGATVKYDGLVNTGAGIAYINQDKAYGTWEFDVNKGADGNALVIAFINDLASRSSNDGYEIELGVTETIYLVERIDGAYNPLFITAASYIAINTDYRIKITRSLAGVFTVYIKGGTFGWDDWTTVSVAGGSGTNPVTDTTYTTSNYLVADLDNTDTISNLKIDGKRISLANAVQSTGTWTTTGPAYSFDGTDDYISIDDTDDLSFGDGTDDSPFSISAWVNMDDATNFMIASKGVYNIDNEWKFWLGGDDKVYFSLRDESVDNCYIGRYYNTVLDENVWLHLVTTYDGRGGVDAEDGMHIYLNGVVVDDTNAKAGTYVAMENLTHDVWIGRYSTTYAEGQIGGLKIWDNELTSTQVEYLYSKERVKY